MPKLPEHLLPEFMRTIYNVDSEQAAKRILDMWRNDPDAGFLTTELESEINAGKYGNQVKELYYHGLKKAGQELTADQEKFWREHTHLIY